MPHDNPKLAAIIALRQKLRKTYGEKLRDRPAEESKKPAGLEVMIGVAKKPERPMEKVPSKDKETEPVPPSELPEHEAMESPEEEKAEQETGVEARPDLLSEEPEPKSEEDLETKRLLDKLFGRRSK